MRRKRNRRRAKKKILFPLGQKEKLIRRLDTLKRKGKVEICVPDWKEWDRPGEFYELKVLVALAEAFKNEPGAMIFHEPFLKKLARKWKTPRLTDVLLVHRRLGIHFFEVKGYALKNIEDANSSYFQIKEKGRQVRVEHLGGPKEPTYKLKDSLKVAVALEKQARQQADAVRDNVKKKLGSEPRSGFFYWLALPEIDKKNWDRKFVWNDDRLLFRGLIENPGALAFFIKKKRMKIVSEEYHLLKEILGIGSPIFYDCHRGDISPRSEAKTLGHYYDICVSQDEKRFSEEQRKIAEEDWFSRGGPRLVRGVAGSGKTIVLARNLARLLVEWVLDREGRLLAAPDRRVLCVCFNKAMVSFLKEKTEENFLLLLHREYGIENVKFPKEMARFHHFEEFLRDLRKRLPSLKWEDAQQISQTSKNLQEKQKRLAGRALKILSGLEEYIQEEPDRARDLVFDAVYVDEAQDLLEEEIFLLCRLATPLGGNTEPRIYIFYDDAQNIYGRPRPSWNRIGLNLKGGRSHVMEECFRNTKEIIETAFNVLLGAVAERQERIGMRGFADVGSLERKKLISRRGDGLWSVGFAEREGHVRIRWPDVALFPDGKGSGEEMKARAVTRAIWLVEREDVRPEDLLILGYEWRSLRDIGNRLEEAGLRTLLVIDEGKEVFRKEGYITLSTVQSAKGHDAMHVILVGDSWDPDPRIRRAQFYVACTRAKEGLDIFGPESSEILREAAKVVEMLKKDSNTQEART